MDDIDFAQSMKRSTSGSQRGRSVRRTDTSTVYGTAISDSADGSVRVDLGGSIIGGDGMVGVTCPTTVTVRKGDTVLVQLVGARGTAQSPIVVGCVGRGDVQQGEINEAKEEADEAKTAAQEAKQAANKTFLERPVPPYRVGDVWMVAGAADYKWSAIPWETWHSVGDIDWYLLDDSSKATVFRCVRAKSRGEEFDPSDWELAQDLKGTFASKSELTKSSREIRAAVKDQWTLTEGLVEQERIDREASIDVRADAILSEVKADYATKGELNDTKTSLSSSIEQTAESITASVSESYATKDALSGEVASRESIVRQTSSGVEVAKKVNGSYTGTKAVIDDDSFDIQGQDGTVYSSFGKSEARVGKARFTSNSVSLTAQPPDGAYSTIEACGSHFNIESNYFEYGTSGKGAAYSTISSDGGIRIEGGESSVSVGGVSIGSGTPLRGIYSGSWVGKTSAGGDATVISAADAKNRYKATGNKAVFLPMNGDTNVSRDIQLTGWQDGGDGSLGVHTNLPNQTIRVNWLLVVGI